MQHSYTAKNFRSCTVLRILRRVYAPEFKNWGVILLMPKNILTVFIP